MATEPRYDYRVEPAIGEAPVLVDALAALDAEGWEPFAVLPYAPIWYGQPLDLGATHIVARRRRPAPEVPDGD